MGIKDQVPTTQDLLTARICVPGRNMNDLKKDLDLLNEEGFSLSYTEHQLADFKSRVNYKLIQDS